MTFGTAPYEKIVPSVVQFILKNVPSTVRFSYLSGIEIDVFLDSPDANGAEVITG